MLITHSDVHMKKSHYTNELKNGIDKDVTVTGWVHDIRALGGINFLLLRDKEGIAQVTLSKEKVPANTLEIFKNLHQEDVVAIKGTVKKNKLAPNGLEIIPSLIKLINKAETSLPLDPRGVVDSNLDTQLDWRVMDFRRKETRAIFKIQSEILKSFRSFLIERGYMEIQPPLIISSATEGGAELFSIPYFEKQAFLAQSPQLYKQMAAISFEKVFMVVPVFRAEKHNRPTHLNELRQMDIEEAFANDEDVMKVLEECFVFILENIQKNCSDELKVLKREFQIPKLPLKRVTYKEAIELLQKRGEEIKLGDDFSKPQEKLLDELVGEEVFFIKDWPTSIKPFYSMPYDNNPDVCRAFDLIHNGLEICSGAQRVHLPNLLVKKLKDKGLNPDMFKSYIDCFRYGAPPHAGWSVGLERITMTITDRKNIRECCFFPRDRNRITP